MHIATVAVEITTMVDFHALTLPARIMNSLSAQEAAIDFLESEGALVTSGSFADLHIPIVQWNNARRV